MPLAFQHFRPFESQEQTTVKRLDLGVHWLDRPAPNVHGDMNGASFKLPFIEETHAGNEERDDRCRLQFWTEHRGGSRLVVILEEAKRMFLKIRLGHQMFAHGT